MQEPEAFFHSHPAQPVSPPDRAMAVLAHMSSFLGYPIPFGQFLAPYTIQLVRGVSSGFVSSHAREVLNFQLNILALLLLGLALSAFGVGWLLLVPVALLYSLAQTVRGARAASRSQLFRYPVVFRLLSEPAHGAPKQPAAADGRAAACKTGHPSDGRSGGRLASALRSVVGWCARGRS